jgi:hypothetical protein
MSYTSTSVLRASATAAQAQEIIGLLGYKKVGDGLKVPNRIAGYMWYDDENYRSWSGVELDVYKTPKGPVKVTTRASASRSFWDLVHQNRTLKLLRDLFGGHFQTDAGRNRYWRPDAPAPSPLSSGCYLARWRFHNGLGRAKVYLMNRNLEGPIARDTPSGFDFMDEFNPRLLSNNLVVPYMVAIWEEYFRATFAACLRFSQQREAALKRAKLSHADLEKIAVGSRQIERSIAETFSFQRPTVITENFRLLDQKLDIGGAIKKPYRGRKTTLFQTIEELIEGRNELVHTGQLNLKLFDKQLKAALSDFTEAVNRSYEHIAKHYAFEPNHNY